MYSFGVAVYTIPPALQIELGISMSDIERRTNTAIAEPQSKVNIRTLTYCAARSRHQNTNVRAHKIDGLALVTSMIVRTDFASR